MLIRGLFLFGLGAVSVVAMLPGAADAQARRARPPRAYALPPAPVAVESRAQFERGLMRSEAALIFAAIIRNFPDESSVFIDTLYNTYVSTVRQPAAARAAASGRVLHDFHLSLLPHLRRAPDADLLRVISARRAVFELLQRTDVATCGRVTATGNMSVAMSPAFMQLNGLAQVALIDAAGAGRRAPVPPRAPSTQDERRLASAAFAQIDPTGDLLPLALGEETVASARPERQCRYAIGLLSLALAVPPEPGAKLAIDLLERAMGAGAPGR